jgi:hypothetical protein
LVEQRRGALYGRGAEQFAFGDLDEIVVWTHERQPCPTVPLLSIIFGMCHAIEII